MITSHDSTIHLVPIKQIVVLNPRDRGKRKFAQIADNISTVGLKKPVSLSPLDVKEGVQRYWLVCGQGRLESFQALGQSEIPAVIVHGNKEQLLLMSLAENIARRHQSTLELLRKISLLKESHYTNSEIAKKTGLDGTYVKGIIQLLAKGEERLLTAVEKQQIPLSIAITIASSDDKAVQKALVEAYERNDLRGRALLSARRLIEKRRSKGKTAHKGVPKSNSKGDTVSADSLLRTYQQETLRQKMLVQKAKLCENRLLFVVTAVKQLFADENFINLVRAESLDTVPQFLADKLAEQETN